MCLQGLAAWKLYYIVNREAMNCEHFLLEDLTGSDLYGSVYKGYGWDFKTKIPNGSDNCNFRTLVKQLHLKLAIFAK